MLSETFKRFIFTDPVNSPPAMQLKKVDIDWHRYKQNSQEASDLMRSNSKHWLMKDVNCKTFWRLFLHLANSHTIILPACLVFAFVSSLLSPRMSQIPSLLPSWDTICIPTNPGRMSYICGQKLTNDNSWLPSVLRLNTIFLWSVFFIFRVTGWRVSPLSIQCSIRRQIKSVWGSLGSSSPDLCGPWPAALLTHLYSLPPENLSANL